MQSGFVRSYAALIFVGAALLIAVRFGWWFNNEFINVLLMLLPIIGSIAVAATPKTKEVLSKQVALATTVIVASQLLQWL